MCQNKHVANLRPQARARSIATFAAIDQLPPAQTSSSREPGSAIAAVGRQPNTSAVLILAESPKKEQKIAN